VLAYGWAQPRIEAHQAAVLRLAVQEVLRQPARYDALFVHDGRIAATLPAGVDSAGVERVYLGYDDAGRPVGFAVVTSKAGFQDQIRVIFGYDAATRRLLGMKVLESKETPGLGDRIEKDSAFVSAFRGVATPLLGVKSGAGRSEENEVDMITGATISSRTLIDAINAALARLGPLLEAYEPGGEP
jgi:electron transport complex protein RnfG